MKLEVKDREKNTILGIIKFAWTNGAIRSEDDAINLIHLQSQLTGKKNEFIESEVRKLLAGKDKESKKNKVK